MSGDARPAAQWLGGGAGQGEARQRYGACGGDRGGRRWWAELRGTGRRRREPDMWGHLSPHADMASRSNVAVKTKVKTT